MSTPITSLTNPTVQSENNDSLPTRDEVVAFNARVSTDLARYHTSDRQDEKLAIAAELRSQAVDEGWISPKPSERANERESREQFNVRKLVEFEETDKMLAKTRGELRQQAGEHGVDLTNDNQLYNLRISRNNLNGRHVADIWDNLSRQERNKDLYLGMIDFRYSPEVSSTGTERSPRYKNERTTGVYNSDSILELSATAARTKATVEKSVEAIKAQAMWDNLVPNLIASIWG